MKRQQGMLFSLQVRDMRPTKLIGKEVLDFDDRIVAKRAIEER